MRPVGMRLALLVLAAGCRSEPPRALVVGLDACEYCRMTVSDVRFGAQVQTRTGKVHAFDSIECLASWYLDAVDRDDVRRVRVTDFETSRMLPADSAVFVLGGTVDSPMGRSLVAFAAARSPASLLARYGGEVVTWNGVLERVQENRMAPGAGPPDSSGSQAHDHGVAR